MATDEILDLVDENDQVIGQISRSEAYAKDVSNIRVINAFIVNSQGQLWIPRRHPSKKAFPKALDMSVGGHVQSGEDYETSFIRETQEELNLDVTKVGWKLLGEVTPKDGFSAFGQVYQISSDENPDYNREDFTEAYWLKPQELIRRIKNGEKAKDDLLPLVERYYT